MRVAILGGGAIGFASAAVLCKAGHDAVLWSPSGRRTGALAAGAPLVATGAVQGEFRPGVAESRAQALDGAECALIAVPGYAHRIVIEAAAPHLTAAQTVLVSSHMSFSAVRLRQMAPAPSIVAWGTTVVTGRQTGPSAVWVTNLRSRVDVAARPAAATQPGLALCRALFGDRFAARDGLLAIALSNLNPQNHLAIALCNLTRMEKGEDWRQYANTTPAVGRPMEALDAERLALARACGVAGPATLDSRYVTEDVPFGLWPTIRLGQETAIDLPLHLAGGQLFSALYGRDLTRDNDILPALGNLADALAAATVTIR